MKNLQNKSTGQQIENGKIRKKSKDRTENKSKWGRKSIASSIEHQLEALVSGEKSQCLIVSDCDCMMREGVGL